MLTRCNVRKVKWEKKSSGNGSMTGKFLIVTEADIRAQGDGKTPDFVLENPIRIDNLMVNWIESKALFGDDFEHEHYSKKQFREYAGIFGEGMVVYWYGYLENLPADGYLVKNYSFFEEYKEEIDGLFNYLVYW